MGPVLSRYRRSAIIKLRPETRTGSTGSTACRQNFATSRDNGLKMRTPPFFTEDLQSITGAIAPNDYVSIIPASAIVKERRFLPS